MTFLRPGACRSASFDSTNVDFLVEWFDEYEMLGLKTECEQLLLTLPCDISRLAQAHQFHLDLQYKRCLKAVAAGFEAVSKAGLEALHAEIMVDLIQIEGQRDHQHEARLGNKQAGTEEDR